MRSNRKILFGLLLILGAFGFYRLYRTVSQRGRQSGTAVANSAGPTDPNVRPASAVVGGGRIAQARVNIPANTIVTPDMLRMTRVESGSTTPYITDIETGGAGFITRVDIPAGANIRPANDFIGHVSETGIAGLLRPGTRAMVIPIANKPTLHDLVRIGNTIDVLAAFDGQESRAIVQNVRVLGVDVSGNDYPNVSVAMRGAAKADAKRDGVRSGEGAVAAGQPGATPGTTPTPNPNAPRPDPALTLEVTPRQAATLQLALASNAPLDYLIRPALPGNRSTEIAPLDGGTSPDGTAVGVQAVSVIKSQIAPYAERKKLAANSGGSGSGGSVRGTGTGGGRGGGPFIEAPPIPNPGTTTGTPPVILGGGETPLPPRAVPTLRPQPTPTQTYSIPVFGNGKILRTETVPLPAPSK